MLRQLLSGVTLMSIKSMLRNVLAVVAGMGAVVGVVCLLLVAFGYRPFILTSPSMEPLYVKGSLVWADTKVKVEDVEVGNVLVYRAPSGNLVMHRLVGDNLLQGDANNTAQEVMLDCTNYIGRETITIPWLGDAVSAVLSVRWIVWSLIGVLVIAACVPQRKEQLA